MRKPVCLFSLREWVEERYCAVVCSGRGLEADDIIGIKATNKANAEYFLDGKWYKTKRIIVSVDKDFYGVPGYFYNTNHPERGIVRTSIKTANYNHMVQTLSGDSTDGYPGCPGIGPVKAKAALGQVKHSYRDMWKVVVNMYEKAGLSTEVAITQARCARILRHEDMDIARMCIMLWHPNKRWRKPHYIPYFRVLK